MEIKWLITYDTTSTTSALRIQVVVAVSVLLELVLVYRNLSEIFLLFYAYSMFPFFCAPLDIKEIEAILCWCVEVLKKEKKG